MKALSSVLFLLWAAPLAAQDAVPAAAPAAPPAAPAPASIAVGTLVGQSPTSYDDGGRRDPFASLIAPKRATDRNQAAAARGRTGLSGVAMADILVRGIVRNGQTMLAILEAPNKQSFVARAKDRLLDASIASIEADGVVFAELNNAGQVVGQSRKALRSTAEDVR